MTAQLYIHELIDIVGHNRAKYQHHMTANWVPVAREERGQRCYGVWSTIGSTGRWPEVVNMWEFDGWDGLVRNFEVETAGGRDQDPSLAEWWAGAASLRRGGFDRILVPDGASLSIDGLCTAGVGGELYCHEIVQVPAGRARELLDAVRDSGEAAYAGEGLGLVGAFRTALRADDECILLWACPSWTVWGHFEQAWHAGGELAGWAKALVDFGATWQRTVLVDAELSPMRIGRQPQMSDRRPLVDV
ncbi:MAG: hypothetical protein QOH79_3471 [Acidimicrobiaceae bacterium]